MGIINFNRGLNGKLSMGSLNEQGASNQKAAAKKFELTPEKLQDYKKIINKKTEPKLSSQELNDVFSALDDQDVLAKK